MKIQTQEREVITVGAVESREASIKMDAHTFAILSGMYKNIEWALWREYWSNAEDGHAALRALGKEPPHPIEIHIPNTLEPWILVKDYGVGMSHETVFDVFQVYGESTKRDNNEEKGGLGIGGKSAHAYEDGGDQWLITSRFDGEVRTYNAFKNEKGIPDLVLLGVPQPTDEPNGITIRIPVAEKDIPAFKTAARRFAKRRTEPFIIRGDVEGVRDGKYDPIVYTRQNTYAGWRDSNSGEHGVQVIMGGVPYAIDVRNEKLELTSEEISYLDKKSSLDLFFGIGELPVSPDREGILYTEDSVQRILAQFQKVLHEDLEEYTQTLETFSNIWEAIEYTQSNRDLTQLMGTTLGGYRKPTWRGQELDPKYVAKIPIEHLLAAHEDAGVEVKNDKIIHLISRYDKRATRSADIVPAPYDPNAPAADGSQVKIWGGNLIHISFDRFKRGSVFFLADTSRAVSLMQEWAQREHSNGLSVYIFKGEGWDPHIIEDVTGIRVQSVAEATAYIQAMRERDRAYKSSSPAMVRYNGGYSWRSVSVDLSEGGIYVKLTKGELDVDHVPDEWRKGIGRGPLDGRFGSLITALVRTGVIPTHAAVVGIPKSRWREVENDPNWKSFWDTLYPEAKKVASKAIPANPVETQELLRTVSELPFYRLAYGLGLTVSDRAPIMKLVRAIERKKNTLAELDTRLQTYTNIAALRKAVFGTTDGKVLKKDPKGIDIQYLIDYDAWLRQRYPMLNILMEETYVNLVTGRVASKYGEEILNYINLVDRRNPTTGAPKLRS